MEIGLGIGMHHAIIPICWTIKVVFKLWSRTAATCGGMRIYSDLDFEKSDILFGVS